MIPYGVKLKDRRVMYDYSSDKYNSRGCFNKCNCHLCSTKKYKIRKQSARKLSSSLMAKNRMRSAKKSARQLSFKIIKEQIK